MMTLDQILADNRMMERFICERLQKELTRIVMADGRPDGPAWVDLTFFWDDVGDCVLFIETDEPDAFRLRDVYDHFRRQERTSWEREREIQGEMNRWKIRDLKREIAAMREAGLRDEVGQPANGEQGVIDCMATVDESGLPREVSTAEAARILGISKDTVLKLKSSGLLEYRNTGSPDSCRPVYAFTLRSVIELRTNYDRDMPVPRQRPDPPRRRVKGERKYKHLNLDD